MSKFYLGRGVDNEKFEYDSKTLLTHAAIVGMTGSGKTGLGIALLEEAALAGVSAIAVDPKGDLTNLLLTFPNLSEGEFAAWADDPAQAAAEWKKGLAAWDLNGENVRAFKERTRFKLYTPGASHGLSVNALGSFAAPAQRVLEDSDLLNSLVSSSAANLLSLIDVEAKTSSKEATLLTAIIGAAWANGEDLDLEKIITRIVKPPFDKVGVFALESFFAEAKRFDLAAKFNSLLASNAFAAWLKGDPLSVSSIYEGEKPTIAVFSIAHLGDKERSFFVTLILNAIVAWMRSRDGSPDLRSLFYMDEIFGYFPPNANPPSKTPMLLLLKQARAFGLGVALSTQNPVDLDYKGMSNIGSWFIGRMQSAQDCERISAGLIGAGAAKGELAAQIAALGKRRFLLKTDRIQTFDTRWTLSYLKGPLSRDQIRSLVGERRVAAARNEATQTASAIVLDANAGKKRAAIELKYEREKKLLGEKRLRLIARLDKEKSDVTNKTVGLIAQIGSALIGAFLGSKQSAAGKISTAVKGAASAQKERADVARVNEAIALVDRELRELEERTKAELAGLN